MKEPLIEMKKAYIMRNLKASATYFRYVNVLKSRHTQITPFPLIFNVLV